MSIASRNILLAQMVDVRTEFSSATDESRAKQFGRQSERFATLAKNCDLS